jgi:protoporphyrinogen oxidase
LILLDITGAKGTKNGIWATDDLFRYLSDQPMEKKRTAVIIGAGPAGLTAAYELLARTDIVPVVLELTDDVGGISRTVEYKGNRMDIGGHRFFSKSDRVMDWWNEILPVQAIGEEDYQIRYRNSSRLVKGDSGGPDPEVTDRVMLVRSRLSRIFYGRHYYDYPIRLNGNTIRNLGLFRIAKIGMSYIAARFKPVRPEQSLEDFFINRFGKELYRTFFKDYTEKVWGVPCSSIKPEWGAQRVKGLSVTKALFHALKSIFPKDVSVRQKKVETSLIDRFLYPKYGPGHLWKEVARRVTEKGGSVLFGYRVTGIDHMGDQVRSLKAVNLNTGEELVLSADFVFSTMPVSELIAGMGPEVPEKVQEVARGLIYRDFIAVGLLYKKMAPCPENCGNANRIPDNWVYIQESDVKVGRIQVFNNWSPWLVKDPETVWLGLEYFCQEGDSLWSMNDQEMIRLGVEELSTIGFCRREDYLDGTVVRMAKTYPAYFGSYDHFNVIRTYTDSFRNLFLLGRNGMHRYNNQDHSMLTAMTAVDLIVAGSDSKEAVWQVNTEDDYHEESSE